MKQQDVIKTMLQELSKSDINPSQAIFITGLKKWYKKTGALSQKQYDCLTSIYSQIFQQVESKL